MAETCLAVEWINTANTFSDLLMLHLILVLFRLHGC